MKTTVSKNLKIAFFNSDDLKTLEQEINDWLSSHYYEVYKIVFNTVTVGGEESYTAMIAYEKIEI